MMRRGGESVTGRLSKALRAAAFLPIAIVVLAGGCDHPRSTPEDATAAADEVSQLSQSLVGKQITIRGKFSALVKGDPYILLDNKQEVYIGPRETTMEDTYSKMDGKLVEATGTLRFYHNPAPIDETRQRAVQREPDHFYFAAKTTQLRLSH
jgi:hypothetical protein